MKKGISIEFDYRDDGYNITKAKGTLTLDDIRGAITDHGDGGRFLLMFDTDVEYQYGDDMDGDFAKVWSIGCVERMFKR